MTIEEQRKLSMAKAERLEEREYKPEEEKRIAKDVDKLYEEMKNGLKG